MVVPEPMLSPIAGILMVAATSTSVILGSSSLTKSMNLTWASTVGTAPFELRVGLTMTLVAMLVYLVF